MASPHQIVGPAWKTNGKNAGFYTISRSAGSTLQVLPAGSLLVLTIVLSTLCKKTRLRKVSKKISC